MFIELKGSGIFVNTRHVVFAVPGKVAFDSGEMRKLSGTDYKTLVDAIEKEQRFRAVRHGRLEI